MVKIVHNKLLGGWFIVTGPHHTPIGGRFPTKEAAQAHLGRKNAPRMTEAERREARAQRQREYEARSAYAAGK